MDLDLSLPNIYMDGGEEKEIGPETLEKHSLQDNWTFKSTCYLSVETFITAGSPFDNKQFGQSSPVPYLSSNSIFLISTIKK